VACLGKKKTEKKDNVQAIIVAFGQKRNFFLAQRIAQPIGFKILPSLVTATSQIGNIINLFKVSFRKVSSGIEQNLTPHAPIP